MSQFHPFPTLTTSLSEASLNITFRVFFQFTVIQDVSLTTLYTFHTYHEVFPIPNSQQILLQYFLWKIFLAT